MARSKKTEFYGHIISAEHTTQPHGVVPPMNTVLIHSFLRACDGHPQAPICVRLVRHGKALAPLIATHRPRDAITFASILADCHGLSVTINPAPQWKLKTPSGQAETFSPRDVLKVL